MFVKLFEKFEKLNVIKKTGGSGWHRIRSANVSSVKYHTGTLQPSYALIFTGKRGGIRERGGHSFIWQVTIYFAVRH